ncbi:acriflavin resistance protein [Defluviimonas sp. 20V17]|uniref:Cation efflux system protein n=1 Tax=Allgaiera indica TaxID=765699 RepID=A0AAN4US79_9RHOB|nr:efflux RND transporter permease subunit [Allgaiera indica]KDB02291.1 acriflavin resistance protein [Defluviimonas sp. 20V17]GHE02806.1 cation efflux system protein [Allgaiera indica]SDX17460.1 heavy metal efflux pump, CzcA family [Allgaiera indica]
MLRRLLRFSLRQRGLVLALAVLLLVVGAIGASREKLDVFPEFAPPMAVVQTVAPGYSSAQVEALVTHPIETALGGAAGVRDMRSRSLAGISLVTVVFGGGADVFRARQLISEQLAGVQGQLPSGVARPRLLPLTTSTSVILTIGLTSKTRSLMDLHDVARWVVKPQLQAVRGVADAIVFGGLKRQLQIQPDPEKLRAHDLSLADVSAAVAQATGARAAGAIDTPNQYLTIEAQGQITTPAQLAALPLGGGRAGGRPVRLGDVAKVAYAPQTPVGAASIMGRPAVMLIVEGQYGANTLAVTQRLSRRLDALRPVLAAQGVTLVPNVFRPADFITRATSHLRDVLVLGAVLVVAVLMLFLMNLRAAAISAVAIPLSMLAALMVLNFFGISMNTMTLGGLAIALGEIVDDAIIDVENILRRLRENAALSAPRAAFRVVLEASAEVRGSVIFATFAVTLVFLPVLMLSGVAGKLFAPLGLAYIAAVLASLGVALTVTPAMSLWLLARTGSGQDRTHAFAARLGRGYRRILAATLRHTRALILGASVLVIAALAVLPFVQGSFIPDLREGHYIVHVGLEPGSSLAESMRVGDRISKALAAIPGVTMVAQRAGRADDVVDPAGVHLSEFDLDLAPQSAAGQDAVLARVRATLARFPGLTTAVNTFLVERIDETISGATAPVVVKVFGNDLDRIDQTAAQIAQIAAKIPGAASVRLNTPARMPRISVRLRQTALARYGLRPVQVLDALRTAYQGQVTGKITQGTRTTDVVVILPPSLRARVADLGALTLRTPSGRYVPLGDLASIRQVAGRYQIAHENGQRLQSVLINLGSVSPARFVAILKQRVAAGVTMPAGVYALYEGQGAALSRSEATLFGYGALSLAMVVLLLSLALRRARLVALVMANLPFALVGGVASTLLAGGNLPLGGMVGFVTLFGISLRNAIMLISHFDHLVRVEGQPWTAETMLRGASERLVPILMTALVTGLGLLPLALTSGAPGNEIEGPMALVILGGLVTSTLLNLLVLPALALRYGDLGRREKP